MLYHYHTLAIFGLYLSSMLGKCFRQPCKSNYTSYKDFCYHYSALATNFERGIEYCSKIDGHQITFKEAQVLGPIITQTINGVFLNANRLFLNVQNTSGMWYDSSLGFIEPQDYFAWRPGGSVDGQYHRFVGLTTELQLETLFHWSQRKSLCIQNLPEKATLLEKFFIMMTWDINHLYYYYDFPRLTSTKTNKSKYECLMICAKDEMCKAVYHSHSVRLCLVRQITDTFLTDMDKDIADDFVRYSKK